MKRTLTLAVVVTLFATPFLACSSSNDAGPPRGSGGAVGSGGKSAAGGAGSGGAAPTGGAPATGGRATGGSATGGSSGNGGLATGGHTAAGGAAGLPTGGSSARGGVSGAASGGTSGAAGSVAAGGALARDAAGDLAVPSEAGADTGAPADTRADGTGPTDAAGAYQPCPSNGDACKILPLGDSITWGVGDEGNGGYRGPLFALAVAAQQKITFTGSQSNGPTTVSGQPFPKKNEGHSGWTIAQIAALVAQNQPFSSSSGGIPHIILLMIGTNDVYAPSGQSEMPKRLESLLSTLIEKAPDALIVVAKITPMTIGGGYLSVVTPYNDAIPPLVQKLSASGKHVVLGDMNTGFNTSTGLDRDGLHPNATGYKFMADRWYSVVGDLLPK